ncbi:MAG: serine/threonine-protein kinase [Polyangiales bacterium]
MSSGTSPWHPGTLVGERYEVVRRLTAGGMGEVFEGRDTKRDLPVALKRLMIEASGSTLDRERRLHEASVRMHREAIHTSRLGHPGIVNVLDLTYDHDATPVVVMELLHGVTLQGILAYTTLPAHVAADWMAQVADALSVAHAAGVVHRDLKPENLFLVEDASMPLGVRVKVLDFGVAKQLSPEPADDGNSDDDTSTAFTMANVFLGSFQYAAPEQFDPAQGVSGRSDLYALGVIFFRALTGQHPAGAKNLNDVMLRTLFGNIERSPRRARPDVPAWLDAVIAQSLELAPQNRFATAEALRDALFAGMRVGYATSSSPPHPSAPPYASAPPVSNSPPYGSAPPVSNVPPYASAPPVSNVPPYASAPPLTPAPLAQAPAAPKRINLVVLASAVIVCISAAVVAALLLRARS